MASTVSGPEASQHAGSSRFEIRGKLGAGGMGVVYRALDRVRGAEVALKVLSRVTGRDVYRFKREFRALADVAHPNLVGLYELHTTGDEWFLTMELVDGVTFIEWVRPTDALPVLPPSVPSPPPRTPVDSTAPTRPVPAGTARGVTRRLQPLPGAVDTQRLNDALYQLCDTVHAMHQAGKLHRDIKPSNVLVDARGRVVLLDFGLVADMDGAVEERTHEVAAAVGTPAYMSPEQAFDRPLSRASDWYSVGVTLYEALTGRRPIDLQGGTPGPSFEILPPAPVELNPDAPLELSELCSALLAQDPGLRPSGEAVLEALGREPSPASRELAISLQTVPFVGRERELEALAAAFKRARGGYGTVVLVRGVSGMGKSALLRHFLEEVASDTPEAIILRGRCYARESVPFKTLDTVVDALTTHLLGLPESDLGTLLPPDVEALARLFPATRRVRAIAQPARRGLQPPDPVELRRRAFGALRELLARLAARAPVIIELDDLQWGDADSGNFLSELILHPEAAPLLLVLAHRAEDEQLSPLLAALRGARTRLAAGARDAPMGFEEITLEPLSDAESRRLVRAVAGESGARAREVVEDAGGSPLFLSEMARAGAAGRSLDEVVQARVARLPEAARRLAHLCAVAAHPLRQAVALRAAGLSGEGTLLAALRAEHLLRVRRSGDAQPELETYHDRVRTAIAATISADEQRELHRALALALEQESAPDREALVVNWLGAGEPERAAAHARLAAIAAEERLAFHRAADLYALALAHGEQQGAPARSLRTRMGHALMHSGRLAESADAFAAAAAGASSEAERLELRRLELEQLLRGGQLERGMALASEMLAGLGLRVPGSRARALLSMLTQRLLLRLRGLDFKERDVAVIEPGKLARLDLLQSLSIGFSFVNPIYGRALQSRLVREVLGFGEPHYVGIAFCLEIGYLSAQGGPGYLPACELGARTIMLGRRLGDGKMVGYAQADMGLASFLSGRFREARERIREGEQSLRDHGVNVRWELDLCEFFAVSTAWYLGDAREAVRLVSKYLHDADERGDAYAQRGLRGWRGNVGWLIVGRPEEARAQLASVARPLEPGQAAQLGHYYEMMSEALIDLYEGAGARAHERVEKLWPALERALLTKVQSVAIEGHYLRARAALAAARHTQNAANAPNAPSSDTLRFVSMCARRIEAERMPWGIALATAARAGVARLAGESTAELDLLRSAAARFDELDMALFAAATRRRLGAVLGGDEGRALTQAAHTVFQAQAVADAAALSRVLLGLD